ncbi:nascent polypeptide-associated complex protein [Candidatus Woesearchaeota archaeon]|nr:nascent polypeptide-associated complex protein [Candidatus Woesearchaeota archaeon]
MIPGINPRQMQQAMRKLGIQQTEIPATEVIIRTEDKEIVIRNPSVQKVNMMGQETFQIAGDIEECKIKEEISEEDIKTVMEQTNVTKDQAKKALEDSEGDLAQAIMNLQA